MKLLRNGFLLQSEGEEAQVKSGKGKKNLPLVTIGVPTYNRADGYLKQALESAVNQTYQNIEIIVADNCSTDHTESVVKGFSDPHIRYFKHTKNIGANKNFNFCLEQARGDYFLLLHDDDLIDEDFVEICMKSANYATDIGLIRTGTRIIDSHRAVLREWPNMVGGLSTEDFFMGWFTGKTTLFLCSTLFNIKRLREIGGFKSKHNLFQDVIAEVQLAARFGRVDVQDVKASFRHHTLQNTVAAKVNEWCEDSLMLLDVMCDLVSENKALMRSQGMRFLCKRNYSRVRAIKSPTERFITYLSVFKKFDYRCFPPIFPKNPLRRGIRYAERRMEQLSVSGR